MDSALPLDEIQIVRAAENMIREHGDEALTKIDAQVENSKSEGFDSFSRTWELIREVIKDEQDSDDKIRRYPPINSYLVGGGMKREDDNFEPLGEVEQALLDAWLKVEETKGCNWLDDEGQNCSKPLAQMSSRVSYCEEHLRRSLTEAGWRKMLAAAGKEVE